MEWKDVENMMERYDCITEEIMNDDESLYEESWKLELEIVDAYESGKWPQEVWESSKYWDDWKDELMRNFDDFRWIMDDDEEE